jgi:hypothetical protein
VVVAAAWRTSFGVDLPAKRLDRPRLLHDFTGYTMIRVWPGM